MAKRIIPASMRLFYEEFHFSPAVLDKDILRCSGVIGVDPITMKALVDPVKQFEQAFLSLGEVLKEAGFVKEKGILEIDQKKNNPSCPTPEIYESC